MIPLRAPIAAPLLFAACLGLGCFVWEPLSRDQSPRDPKLVAEHPAIHLRPGERSAGDLDCKAGRCDQWFRLRIERGGTLRVELRVDGLAERAVARLFLQDAGGKTLAEVFSSADQPLRVERAVEPGSCAVLVHAGGGPVRYVLETALE